MKKLAIAMALALGVVSGAADAALLCKNSVGQEIRWQAGWTKPVILANDNGDVFKNDDDNNEARDFDVSKGIICFVTNTAYVLAGKTGLPYIEGLGNNFTGVIYRGDMARFLLENLPGLYGYPAVKQDIFDRKP